MPADFDVSFGVRRAHTECARGRESSVAQVHARTVLNALKADSAVHNENVLMGFEASEPAGQKIGIRLIAGVIARRIVPFAEEGDVVARGERISLIQFGSRVDVYLPASAKIKVKLGDRSV